MTALGFEIISVQIDREIILSHHTQKTLNIKFHNKTVEAVHQNLKVKIIKYNQLKKINQTLLVVTTQKKQSYN